jgi:hypothetical protein
MTPYFKSFLYAVLVAGVFGAALAVFGCSNAPPRTATASTLTGCVSGAPRSYRLAPDGGRWYLDCVNQPDPADRSAGQSWDQANLKRNDHGCPTAVFVAPNGELVECQLTEDPQPAVKDDSVQYFKTSDEAAIYVVGKIYDKSRAYEYGGVILKAPKGYVVSVPSTQRHGTDVSFDEDPESYDFPIVATYHVHPCLKNVFPSVFSPQDLAGARAAKTPAYVLDECTGSVHYWAPGDGYMSADDMLKLGVNPIALMEGVQLSAGKVVGAIKVDGVILN